MTNSTSPQKPTTEFDFSGLGKLATCEAALQPLTDTIDTYVRVRAEGGIPPETLLVSAALKAAQVMTHSSLFKSNCVHVLQGLPYTRDDDQPEDMPTFTRITAVTHVAWQNICAASALRPTLLHHKSVCDTLRNAFGTEHRWALGKSTLKCYGAMLHHLDGIAMDRITPSLFTTRLGDQIGDWAYKVGLQRPLITEDFPRECQPHRLADKAYNIGLRLTGSPAAV